MPRLPRVPEPASMLSAHSIITPCGKQQKKASQARVCLQEWAVRILKKARVENDSTKVEEFVNAVQDLALAHRIFFYLRNLANKHGVRVAVDDQKLGSHLDFCHETHVKALALAEQVQSADGLASAIAPALSHSKPSPHGRRKSDRAGRLVVERAIGTCVSLQAEKEAEAIEYRRQRSKMDMEMAMKQKKAQEEAGKRAEARRAAERDIKAREAQERLKALKESWAEQKVVAEVGGVSCRITFLLAPSAPECRGFHILKERHDSSEDKNAHTLLHDHEQAVL